MTAVRPFRFGVVATPTAGPQEWLRTARRVADTGCSSLLMPDGLQLLAPFPALALAAGAADIVVGTWVLAAPLRPPRLAAWEAHSLSVLTDGRFELGIGTGRPGVERSAQELGLPYGSPAQRLAQVEQVVAMLRDLDGAEHHTPVIVAASGPRALRLAGAHADIVTLATGALASRDDFSAKVRSVRAAAGPRADDLEFVTSLFVVGDRMPPHVERYVGTDLATLRSAESLALLSGTPDQMADELKRRRDEFGTSYVTVSVEYLDELAPVVERLAGR